MIRKAGFALMAVGLVLVAWVGVTLKWGEPFTSLYTRHEQQALSKELQALDRKWSGGERLSSAARSRTTARAGALRARAAGFRQSLRDGRAFGRIIVPRLGLNMVVIEGTSEGDLQKGPGHYNARSGRRTSVPGLGGVIAIAGHRTTYLHPFRHIDALRPGDGITLVMPYGTFRYRVYYHRVVDSREWRILRPRPFEKLVLTACHPLYSASHRFVVYARLKSQAFRHAA
ncbi:MAG TPA: class D sortase [Gaiellaceae bacterium]